MTRRHFFFALTLIICAPVCAVDAEELRLTASEWRPYVDSGVQGNGFAAALVARALERAGYDVTVDIGAWPDALKKTVAGERDVFATLWFTDERAEDVVFSEPYIECEITFIRRSDGEIRIGTREDLLGLKIGVVDDFAYSPDTVDTAGIEIMSFGSVTENIAGLRDRELDLVLADRRVAMTEINENALAKSFDVLPDPLISRGLRIGVSKERDDAADIVAAFEREIAKMQEDGSYNAILATFRISH
jgi:polar amino acid transport system substrate-binding protein